MPAIAKDHINLVLNPSMVNSIVFCPWYVIDELLADTKDRCSPFLSGLKRFAGRMLRSAPVSMRKLTCSPSMIAGISNICELFCPEKEDMIL